MNEGKRGHVVCCLVIKRAVFLKKRKSLSKNDYELGIALSVDTNLREVHLREYVVRNEEVELFIGLGLPPADEVCPCCCKGRISLDLCESLALHCCCCICSESGHSCAVGTDEVSCASCCVVGCGEAHESSHVVFRLSLDALLFVCLYGSCKREYEVGVEIFAIVNVDSSSGPLGRALPEVKLCVYEDSAAYVEGVSSVVLEEGVELLGHGVNEVTCHDLVAVFPLKVITKSDSVCTSGSAFGNAPLSVNLCGNVLELGSRAVLGLKLAGKDVALSVILEVKGEEGRTDPGHNLGVVVVLVSKFVPVRRGECQIRVVRIRLGGVGGLGFVLLEEAAASKAANKHYQHEK